ncbi:MAG: hypothetical protein RL603_2242 [Pseudomonadota bacterium]
MRIASFKWFLVCTFAALWCGPLALAARPITHEDLWLMNRVGAPSVSPDGRWAVFTVVEPSYDEKAQVTDLWLVPTDASAPARRLTSTKGRESAPDWSPDARKLVFSARRDGDETEQLYLLDLAGGDAQRLTNLVNGARAPVFSPDGRSIAFASSSYPGAASEADNKRIAAERKARKWNARVYDGFPVRNWDRWIEDRKPRAMVIDLPRAGAAPAEPRDVFGSSQLVRQSGYAGAGGEGGDSLPIEWTPDGAGLVFVASTDRDTAAFRLTSTQLWYVPREGGEPRRLTNDAHSWGQPRFSPDGKRLLATRERNVGKTYVKTELAVFDWTAERTLSGPRMLTDGFDRSVTSYAQLDANGVLFLAEEAGHEKPYLVRFDGKAPQLAFDVREGVYTNLSIARGAPIVLANFESATRTPQVVRLDLAARTHRVLASFDDEKLAALDLPKLREFWFTSARGKRIHNFMLVPPGFDPDKKYPLLVVIHGGPHSQWRDQWVLRWNYHLLGAPGYVVLLTNYTGSTGFGEAFAQGVQGDPLASAGEELNQAADVAIRDFAFVDGTRSCAAGASYGGHLSNWLQATTTRYRCLVSHAGLINLESQWATSDTIYSRELNNGGPVWEQGSLWREQNPIRRAAAFATPTLVTVGEQDFRVPLNNSLEYWSVLQRRQIPSRLIVFPEENHWVLRGENSRYFFGELHAWFARWLGPEPTAGQTNR